MALSAFGGFTNLGFTPVQPTAAGPLTSDLNMLNYALTLEHLESAAYRAINNSGVLTGRAKTYFDAFGAHEQTHVNTLASTITSLGGTPVTPPARGYNFSSVPTDTAGIVAFFKFVEDVGASAYLGAAGAIQNDDLLEAALSIHAVEAEHAAALADIAAPGETGATAGSFTPDGAFARFRTPDQVFSIVGPFYTPTTSPFSDVDVATPYSPAILYLARLGIARGQDGKFMPNMPLLRVQMAGFVARAFLWADETYNNPFTDQGAADNELWNDVSILANYKVAFGYSPTEFDPWSSVISAQVISFVARAMITKGFWAMEQSAPADQYPNAPQAHRADIATYVKNTKQPLPGTNSTTENWNQAAEPASRAFAAEAVYRALRAIDTTPKVIVPAMM